MSPQMNTAQGVLSQALYLQGRFREAVAEAASVKDPVTRFSVETICRGALGDAPAARQAEQAMIEAAGGDAPYDLARVRAAQGDLDAAFDRLHEAVARRDPLLQLINAEPLFLALHDDPHWSELRRELGLPAG